MTVRLDYPFRGRWLARHSPASRVPSHGTTRFASSHAIDFVPVDEAGRSAPVTLASVLRPEPAEHFPGFGRELLAPADGVVLAVSDGEDDHPAHRGLPSLAYAWTQPRRVATGWPALAGNVVLLDVGGGVVVALCHLQRGSATVVTDRRVRCGEVVGRCGNSGNSTEPHVHVQAMDGPDPGTARAVPMLFRGSLPREGEVVEA